MINFLSGKGEGFLLILHKDLDEEGMFFSSFLHNSFHSVETCNHPRCQLIVVCYLIFELVTLADKRKGFEQRKNSNDHDDSFTRIYNKFDSFFFFFFFYRLSFNFYSDISVLVNYLRRKIIIILLSIHFTRFFALLSSRIVSYFEIVVQ